VRLPEPVHLDRRHRAVVTILADEPSNAHETALLSEAALAENFGTAPRGMSHGHTCSRFGRVALVKDFPESRFMRSSAAEKMVPCELRDHVKLKLAMGGAKLIFKKY
jgi:hypothetical protein